MDYEKKYKEALQRAKHALDCDKNGLMNTDKPLIMSLFPELKESEDERIRKALIEMIHDTPSIECEENYNVSKEDILAWLEKQGEQKLAQEKEPFETNKEEKVDNHNCIKPTDKVEPKFKVGDWIVCGGLNTAKIIKIDGVYYEVEFIDGNKGIPQIDYIDRSFRPWTILDAKDGDVLVALREGSIEGKKQIFIFKDIKNRPYRDNCIEYYCRVYDGEFYINKSEYMGTIYSPLYPATKEQRETLFKAMADAGYEFDFDKKELKKIK